MEVTIVRLVMYAENAFQYNANCKKLVCLEIKSRLTVWFLIEFYKGCILYKGSYIYMTVCQIFDF